MKTAEKWLMENQGSLRGLKIFEKFIAEHDNEIIQIIDEMVRTDNHKNKYQYYHNGWCNALTELKEKLK